MPLPANRAKTTKKQKKMTKMEILPLIRTRVHLFGDLIRDDAIMVLGPNSEQLADDLSRLFANLAGWAETVEPDAPVFAAASPYQPQTDRQALATLEHLLALEGGKYNKRVAKKLCEAIVEYKARLWDTQSDEKNKNFKF
jgi:hypothetical protein